MLENIWQYLTTTRLGKTNYRGEPVLTGGGLFFIWASLLFWSLYQLKNIGQYLLLEKLIFLVSIIGAVGIVDDLAGSKDHQGFKGHLLSLLQGQLTTGFLKAAVSAAAAFLIIYQEEEGFYFKTINFLIILLMTNLINLFDLRPGRALKFFLLLCIPLFFQGGFLLYLLPIFLVMFIYFPLELKGKVMLGDTGSNTLGAILGLAYIHSFSDSSKLFTVLILLFFNIISEWLSFSEIIKNNRYLNWLDYLGRKD